MRGEGREVVDGAGDALGIVGNEMEAVGLGCGWERGDALCEVGVELGGTGGFARGGEAGYYYQWHSWDFLLRFLGGW